MLKNSKYLVKLKRSITVCQEAQINSLPDFYIDEDAFRSKNYLTLLPEINKPSREYYRSCLVSNIQNVEENHINKQLHMNIQKTASSHHLKFGEFNCSSCRKWSNSSDPVAYCPLQNNSVVNFSNETIFKSAAFKDSSDVLKQGNCIKEVKKYIPMKTVFVYNVNSLSSNFKQYFADFNHFKSFLFMKFKTNSNLENYKFFHTQKMPFNHEIHVKNQKQTFPEKRYYSQTEEQFECPYCHQSFSSRALLESHVMYTHSTHSSQASNTSLFDSFRDIIFRRNVDEKENSENKAAESEIFENQVSTDNSESKNNEINSNADNKLSENKESGRNKNNEIDEIVVPSDGGGGGGGDCM